MYVQAHLFGEHRGVVQDPLSVHEAILERDDVDHRHRERLSRGCKPEPLIFHRSVQLPIRDEHVVTERDPLWDWSEIRERVGAENSSGPVTCDFARAAAMP